MDAAGYESFIRDEGRHFWFIGRRAIFEDVLRFRVPALGKDAITADLGCGVGGMLDVLGRHGRAVGMEVSSDLLALCRRRGFSAVLVGRGDAVPLASGCFDLVAMFDVLEHIPQEAEALSECLRILRPGGWLMLSGPSYQFLYAHQDKVVQHQRRYTVTGLRRTVASAGFEVEYASYINCFLFPVILPLILLRKLREWIVTPGGDESRLNTEIRIPERLNRLFARVFAAERLWLRRGSLPFGHSLILLARKPDVPRS